jgi:hypothetical protein
VAEWILSGRIVDLILILVLIEIGFLAFWRRVTGRGFPLPDVIGNVIAGVFLLLSLRAALTDSPWAWVAAGLVAALIGHLYDLWRRWSLATQIAEERARSPGD